MSLIGNLKDLMPGQRRKSGRLRTGVSISSASVVHDISVSNEVSRCPAAQELAFPPAFPKLKKRPAPGPITFRKPLP